MRPMRTNQNNAHRQFPHPKRVYNPKRANIKSRVAFMRPLHHYYVLSGQSGDHMWAHVIRFGPSFRRMPTKTKSVITPRSTTHAESRIQGFFNNPSSVARSKKEAAPGGAAPRNSTRMILLQSTARPWVWGAPCASPLLVLSRRRISRSSRCRRPRPRGCACPSGA